MRAFKQFLSLVLVTCMLTSMFTIVSAVGPQVYARTWDSDSGHITIQQGESGQSVDSGYVKYADSNYVKVELDENKTVEVDLTSGKEDVTVTLTGENLAGSFDLKVLDTGKNNLVYMSKEASSVQKNTDKEPGDSDDWKITFEVPPVSMAGGSTLAVYPAGSDALAWEISYKTSVKGSLTADKDTPAEIPTVSEEGSTTVPAAAVAAVLENVGKEATEAYVSVSAPAEGGSLLLDTSVFNNSKFDDGSFALHIQVEGKDGASYTWTFTQASVRSMALLSDSSVDLNVTVDKEAKFGKDHSISGTFVKVQSNVVPDGMSAELTVETDLTGSVKAFYQDGSQKWVEDSVNANLTVKDEKVTFEVSKAASEYAIVASGVGEDEMNPTTESETTYSVEVVNPSSKELSLSKNNPDGSVEIRVVDDDNTVLDSGKYKVDWESGNEAVATVVKDSGYKGEGAQRKVTAQANGSATVTATVTLNEGVEGTLSNNSVSVNVTVTGFENPADPAYAITITPDKATIKVGETTTLKAVVTEDGKTLSDAAVTWTTSDSKVATVNNGTVTAVAEGPATITATYTPTDGKPCTAEAVITVTEDEVPEITIKLDPTVRFVYIGRAPVTLTATVTGTKDKAVFTTEDNGLILLTDNGDNTATVKGLKAGDTTVTATVGGKTATCKILVRVYHGGGSGGGSSSGGGGSWNDGSHGSSMPSAGSGTTTTPGTGTTTPGTGTSGNAQPQGCVSDTVGNFSVKGSYQYKLTSTNGQAPAVTVSNSNFRVVLASQNGKDYFFKVYAVGAVGQTCDVLVNGTKVSTVTASEVYGGVSCDTTAPFTVKKGGSYQFKLTASSKPVMAAGSSSFRVEYVGNSGNDWFFKVYAVGNAGDGCGFYVNGAPFTVAVAHIGE